MLPQRQAEMAVVGDDLAAGGHRAERDGRLLGLGHDPRLAGRGGREERQGLVGQPPDGPERLAPGEAEGGAEGIGLGELDERGLRHRRAAPEVVDRGEGLVGPGRDDGGGMGIGEAPDHAQPEPHREASLVVRRLQGAVPA